MTRDQFAQFLEEAGFVEYTEEEDRRNHERLGHCPMQPCLRHGYAFYGGRPEAPWEWETAESYKLRRTAEFMAEIDHVYAGGPEPCRGTWL